MSVAPSIYLTSVGHERTAPLRNAFRYRSYHWLVDVDALPVLPRWARPLARFDAADHCGDPGRSLRDNVTGFLADRGVDTADGRILMLAHARVLGYVFNPLSVFWCHDRAGDLTAVVAEVHNTYGGRHRYLLLPDGNGSATTAKELYVSPFYPVDGTYEMRLPVPGESLDLRITLSRPGGAPFVATLTGTRRPATTTNLARAFCRAPWVTLLGAAQIRYQGIKLWARRLPVAPRPPDPDSPDRHPATSLHPPGSASPHPPGSASPHPPGSASPHPPGSASPHPPAVPHRVKETL